MDLIEEKLEANILKNPGEVAKFIIKSAEHDNLIKSLWEILESTKNKKLKKSCKKVIYILKSNGFKVDDLNIKIRANYKSKVEKKDVNIKDNNEELYKAFLYIPDSLGNSRLLISLYIANKANYEIFDIIYNMDEGIKQSEGKMVSKNMLKRIVENEVELVEVSPGYALGRLNDVISVTNTQGKIPEKIKKYTEGIGAELHPVLSIYPASISSIVSSEEEKELFSRPEIARLMIQEKYITGYKEEVLQAQNSVLIINNMSPEQRINQTINRFVQHYFTPQRFAMYRTLLLDIALYFHTSGERVLAKRLVGYAEELIRPMKDISSHPFIRLLVYKSFFMD